MRANIQTQLSWLRDKSLSQAAKFVPFGKPSTVHVAVEKGLMAGVSTCMTKHTLTIGSGPDCDLQLLDNGVAEEHVTLRLQDSIFGTLVEVAAQATALIPHEKPLEPGAAPRLLRFPLVLIMGDATVRLSTPLRARRFSTASVAKAVLVFVVSAGVFLTVNQVARSAHFQEVRATVQQQPVPMAQLRPDSVALSRARLASLGLASDVILENGPDTSLVASGNVPDLRWAQWQDFRFWYDQQAGLPTLNSRVTLAPKLVTLRPVSSVQLHAPATVYFAVGQPARVGDQLEEGWTLIAIDQDGLTLERVNETTRIRF